MSRYISNSHVCEIHELYFVWLRSAETQENITGLHTVNASFDLRLFVLYEFRFDSVS